MKHRWIIIAAATATLVLGACAPPEQGADVESVVPASSIGAEPSATATPYTMDDY